MTFGLTRRYYCTNSSGCKYARQDHVYNEAQFKKYLTCQGVNGDGCGQLLTEGDSIDTRERWLLASLVVVISMVAVAWFLKPYYFPSPVSGVGFETKQTRVNEDQLSVEVVVTRESNIRTRADVQYLTVDGKAKAGLDYVAAKGELIFEAGENERHLSITLLPDGDYSEDTEHFMLVLSNVEGQPQHSILIEQPKPDEAARSVADALVRELSRIASEIAGYYVKEQTIFRIVQMELDDKLQLQQYRDILETTSANMRRARERYVELFHDLKNVDRNSVFISFDNRIASLDQIDFHQQKKATDIARNQFERYLASGILTMDVWVQQLSDAVPKQDKPNIKSNTLM